MYQLRELARKDIPVINRWRNNPDLLVCLGAPFRYIDVEVDIQWYENYMSNRGNAVRCAIVDERNVVLGVVSLLNVDYLNQSAELSIMIGDTENCGKGIGSYAVRTIVEHGFYNMNLHRIALTALRSNERACHVYEKVGFKREGILRDAKFKNGKFVTMYQYAILRDEYKCKEVGGGIVNLPTYCMERIRDKHEKYRIMQECDNAFEMRIMGRNTAAELIEKIHLYAEFFVAHSENILGYAAVYINDYKQKRAYLTLIAVSPDAQKNGIGKKLLEQCESAARQNGMRTMVLEVNKDNLWAIGFYQRSGFYFYQETSNNSIYMRKYLS